MHLSKFADVCSSLADRCNANTTKEYHHLYQTSLVSQDIEISGKTKTFNSLVVGAFSCRNGVRDR